MRFLWMLIASFPALVVGQVPGGGDPPDTPYIDYEVSRNKMATASVSGLLVNQKVSGTKVEFSIGVSVGERPVGPHWSPNEETDWTQGKVTAVSLKIGGELIALPAVPPGTDAYAKSVRFASTHFNDGSAVPVELTANVLFERVVSGVVVESEPRNLSKTVTLQTYNKGLVLSTLKEPNGYQHPDPPPTGSLQAVSHQLCVDARVRLSAMKHTNDGWDVKNRSAVLAALAISTVFVGCTHGSSNGFFSSYSNDPEEEEFLNWPDVGGAVLRPPSTPGHNLALLYACQTIEEDSAGPNAFGVVGTNRAYGGFGVEVGQLVLDVATGQYVLSLAKHADRLLQELQEGESIEEALRMAENAWLPLTAGLVETGLLILEDKFFTLNCVYVSANEIATYGPGKGKWYLVL